jgi:two-component system sensor histidine kinase PilS (NtrC family)
VTGGMRPRSGVIRSVISLAAFGLLMLAALGLRRQWFPHPVAERAASAAVLSIVVGLSVLAVAAMLFRRWGRSSSAPSGRDEGRAGFVMQTFQEVLRQLKDKEAELEHLRARAVARAEDVESYHQNILRSIASGVITCDPTGRITTFNAAAERILGCEAARIVGRTCHEVFGSDGPITEMVRRSVDTLTPISRQEWRFARGHDRVSVGFSSAILRDRSGGLIGAALVFTDLTEIKRLEEQVEAERRLAVLGEMSAAIAHEFRNSMGTIHGWAKLLSKRVDADATARPMVDAIGRELGVMQRLIDDLLAFGRRMEPQCQRIDLGVLVSEGVTAPPDRPDVRIDTVWDPQAPAAVEWDPTLMRQVLRNLVQNAIEAMPDGGLLRLAIAPSHTVPAQVELVVSDTGIGIPSEHRDRIFDPFFTLKARGHGLGLALVRKIVIAHGGRITVQSTEGAGTTFRLTIPVHARRDTNPAARLEQAA